MNKKHIKFLLCPNCSNADFEIEEIDLFEDGDIENGLLVCKSCKEWYPIEEGVLELLIPPLRYEKDRSKFIHTFKDRIRSIDFTDQPNTTCQQEACNDQIKQQQHSDWYSENKKQTYNAVVEQPLWKAFDKIVYPDWIKKIQDNTVLLDVGCAKGRSTFPFAEKKINILGFDISKNIVKQAQKKYLELSPPAKISFFVADASKFPVKSNILDYIQISGVLHHLPDPSESCKEIYRVLKSGGIYLGCENNESIFRGIFDILQKLKPLWYEGAGSEPLISSEKYLSWFNGLDIELTFKTILFLPPHLVNILGHALSTKAFKLADAICSKLPIIKKNGGLIVVEGQKK